jgi:hypothetical protein
VKPRIDRGIAALLASFGGAAALAFGCHSTPPPPAPAVIIPPAPPAPSAALVATAAPSAQQEAPPEDPAAACSDEAFAKALDALEKATTTGDRDKIAEALAAAISLRASNPELRIRRMEFLLAGGEVDAAAAEAQIVAEVTDGANALAWLLLGRAAQAARQQEDGRALLARSRGLQGEGVRAPSRRAARVRRDARSAQAASRARSTAAGVTACLRD